MRWKRCVILQRIVREGLAREGDIRRPEGSEAVIHADS